MLTFFIAGALISVGLFKDCLFLTTGWWIIIEVYGQFN
jgi:hypothetical protein